MMVKVIMSNILAVIIILSLLNTDNAETLQSEKNVPVSKSDKSIDQQDSHVLSWVEIFGKTILLHARHSIPSAEITMVTGPVDEGGWRGGENGDAVKLIFKRKDADAPVAVYLISPWQNMSWKGTGVGHPEVVTVTKHAVVLGPIKGGDYSKDAEHILERSRIIVEDMAMKEMCDRGTQIGSAPEDSPMAIPSSPVKAAPIYRFRPYYLWINYPSDYGRIMITTDDAVWSAIVQKRMLLVTQEKNDPKAPGAVVTYKWFSPADILRTRPRPFDSGEQRLSPEVNLKIEHEKLDRVIRGVFGKAVEGLLNLSDIDNDNVREEMYEALLPSLKEAVFSYPGHSGPAHAAGAVAYEAVARELKELMFDEVFFSYEKGHWPATLPFYRPELIVALKELPSAESENLTELSEEFKRIQEFVRKNSVSGEEGKDYTPSSDELLLAEVGDRIRTIIKRSHQSNALDILKSFFPGKTSINYNGFEFGITDPLGSHVYRCGSPIKVEINLTAGSVKGPRTVDQEQGAGGGFLVKSVVRGDCIILENDQEIRLLGVVVPDKNARENSRGMWKREGENNAYYKKIAGRIIGRIISLKNQYPHFALVDKYATREEADDKFWIAFHYTNGMSFVTDPDYRTDKLGGNEKKVFSEKDGIELHLYFYKGQWDGQAMMVPHKIGEMNVVAFLEGAETEDIDQIRKKIFQIIDGESHSRKVQEPGLTALMYATVTNYFHSGWELMDADPEIVRLLVAKGAEVDNRTLDIAMKKTDTGSTIHLSKKNAIIMCLKENIKQQ